MQESMRNYIMETPDQCQQNIMQAAELTQIITDEFCKQTYKRIQIVASGSSYNAAVTARYFMEKYIMENRITKLFNIKYPIIQGGMVWCSGWRLASAVSNNGGLGLLGAGSMHPEVLVEHIWKMKEATDKPWGINVPLLYPEIDRLMNIIIQEGVKIVFTSAGSPKKWTPLLKSHGITVVHVISSALFAKKCEEAGVDAVVAEGFEAGGHNGREETTTLTLIPNVVESCSLPVIAAGGISSGKSVAAAMTLGAEGVQIGTRFAVAAESSAHPTFKQRVFDTEEGAGR